MYDINVYLHMFNDNVWNIMQMFKSQMVIMILYRYVRFNAK